MPWVFYFNNSRREVIVRFVDIGRIVDHHYLEVIVCFLDIGGIVDHHCLEVVVCFADNSGIIDHHCLDVIFFSFLYWCQLLTITD